MQRESYKNDMQGKVSQHMVCDMNYILSMQVGYSVHTYKDILIYTWVRNKKIFHHVLTCLSLTYAYLSMYLRICLSTYISMYPHIHLPARVMTISLVKQSAKFASWLFNDFNPKAQRPCMLPTVTSKC